jgi:hypothetical protein
MPRTMPAVSAVATLLVSLTGAGLALAQATYPQPYPPQYPQQQYPQPQQQSPQQQYPQQQYPQQPQYPQPQYPQAPQPYTQPGYAQPTYPQQQAYAPMPAPSTGAFAEQGQFIISADRLFGVSLWSDNIDADNNVTVKTSGTAINLLFGSDGTIAGPFSTPRLGFDFTVAKSVTIGGSLGFISKSGSEDRGNGTTTTSSDSPTLTAFTFAPRAGYILVINPLIALWLRGGLSYFTASTELKTPQQTQTNSLNEFAVDLEPQFVITPIPHLGFTAGLLGDIPLSGNGKQEVTGAGATSTSFTEKVTNWGLALGLFGYL